VPQLINSIKNIIFSKDFCARHKQNPNDFVRSRILPFHEVIYFLLNMNNKSYQEELDRYFRTLHNGQVPERVVFKGSLSKARAKLKHEAFVELNDHLANSFYNHFEHETWFGFNLLAIDGTTLLVPAIHEIANHFGSWVYQDFHAKLFSKNLAATIASTTKKAILKKSEKLKYVHQIKFAQALSKMKNTIILLFARSLEEAGTFVEKIRTIFIQTTEAIRPNRKYRRRHRVKQARFFYEYKTIC